MRTTLDIDDPVLADLRRLQKLQGKSLGRLASDLLAKALAESHRPAASTRKFRWVRSPMQARVDLADRDALLDAMDEPGR